MSVALFHRLEKYRVKKSKMPLASVISEAFFSKVYSHAGEWALECRKLSRSESSEPGNFDYRKTPYMKSIYEAAESGLYRRVVLVCGAQTSKTETFLNILGHRLDTKPVASVIVLPSKDLCKIYSKKRVSKLIANSTLRDKCISRQDQVLEKVVNGHFLSFAWSTSSTTLCSSPFGFALLDEIDRFETDSQGEGDPITLVEARGATFSDFLMLCNSTPTVEGNSAIDREFQKGTKQRLHYVCPSCSGTFLPILENLKWEHDKPWTAYLMCPICQKRIYDNQRLEMNEKSIFLGDGQQYKNGQVIGSLPKTTISSFWVYGLCSPWKSFVDRATSFWEACKKKDQYEIMACVNTAFGELFRVKGEAPEIEEVLACRQEYPSDVVPDGVQILLAGIDCQKNRFYYTVRGYRQGGESYLISFGEMYGEIEDKKSWDRLANFLEAKFFDNNKRLYQISQVMIDSGYQSALVYEFCLRNPQKFLPAKGQQVLRAPVVPTNITHNDKNFKLFHIYDSYFKEKLHAEIKRAEKRWHLCMSANDDYAKSITAEQLIVRANGVKQWVKVHERNDFLDCEKLCDALAHYIGVFLPAQAIQQRPRVISKGIER